MKKINNILSLLAAVAYVIIVSGFIDNTEKNRRISEIKISITDGTKNQFIKKRDIEKIIEANNFKPVGSIISEIDLERIERSLKGRQIISKAEAFVTEPGVVWIEISQKTPFVRIFNRMGQGYYLDRAGNIIPLSTGFGPFVLVASGYIGEPFQVNRTINIMDVKHDSVSRSLHTIYDVYKLADYITKNVFLNSQFEQIYVNSKYEFELIPRVGSHVIEIEKLRILKKNLKTSGYFMQKV